MIRKALIAGTLATFALAALSAGAQEAKPQYTVAEYNAYQACVNDANAASKLKCFEGFETTYPQSTLLPFVYPLAVQAAGAARDNNRTISYADKVLGLGEKAEVLNRFQAYYLRAFAFHQVFNPRLPNATEMATKARTAAEEGVALVPKITKPENVAQDVFDQQVKDYQTLQNYTIGVTSTFLKDFKRAIEGYQAALVTNPGHAFSRYQLGVAYLQVDPPQYMDGFWSVARAISLKVPGEAQVRSYLKNQIMKYQGGRVQCDKETDAQIAELLSLAAASPERPADYTIPTAAELEAVQNQINILTMLKGLQEGGRTAKITWLASCGLEFPEVQGKVMSAEDNGSGVSVGVFVGQSEEEFEKATTANITAKVADQPEAARLKKDELVKFAGHVAAFTPEPFLVTFDKVKVDPTTIPEAEPAAATKKTPKKAPAKKGPPKRPPSR